MTTKVSLIADSSVTGAAINNLTITTDDIANNAVTTSKIDFGTALVPLGAILMWSGVTAPSGYQLCNNSELPFNSPLRSPTVTKTPDLRDRFIVGAGNGYAVGNTGGDNSVALGFNNVPKHSHGVINVSDPGNHYHGAYTEWGFDVEGNKSAARFDVNDGPPFKDIKGDMGAGSHTHTITIDTAFGNAQGGTDAHENRPPYYALAFIMRVL
jgi:microcystin-dependent protein